MKFTIIKEPIPYLIIDRTYTIEEQIQIYSELDFLVDKLQGPEHTHSAIDCSGNIKKNRGIFLDDFYKDLNFSNIFKCNRKLFKNEIIDALHQCHPAYSLVNNINFDSTLLSYYDDGESYFSHTDFAIVSMVTWFFKEPKNFEGGDFKFTDYNLEVEVKNNRTVIFFSSYNHEVSEVKIKDKSIHASGRFTLTNLGLIDPAKVNK